MGKLFLLVDAVRRQIARGNSTRGIVGRRRLLLESLEQRTAPANLTLAIAADQIAENAGAAATTGTLTRSGMDMSQPLTVNLSSSDTTEATVPSQVTFAANETTIPFDVNAVDDAIVDGTQTVTVTGTATIGGGLAIDSGFGGGKVTHNILTTKVAIQPDGKVIATGPYYTGNAAPDPYDFMLARYHPNGSLDTTFGNGGIVVTDVTGESDKAYGIAIQSDGKIVVAGTWGYGPKFDWIVTRYNSDGSLDTTFGTGGNVINDFTSGSYNEVWDMSLQPDGKILVAGNIDNGSPNYADMAVVRYNTDGSLDSGFGTGGVAKVSVGSGDRAFGIALQTDGKIVLCGVNSDGNSISNLVLARFTTTGTLDSSFGSGGTVYTNVTGSYEQANDVVIQPDGKIVVVGEVSPTGVFPPVFDFVVARYNIDGSLDTSFGTNGYTIKDFGGDDPGLAIGLQADGQILVAGKTGANKTSTLARFTAQGVFDSSVGGSTSTNPGDLVVDSSGRAYVAGFNSGSFGGYVDAFSTGQVLSAFDTVQVTDSENQAPVASDGTLTTNEDTTANGTLIANDPENSSLTFSLVNTADAHGTVTITNAATGDYTYTPADDYNGPANFTFTANDGSLESNVATVTITVNPVNDAPTLDAIADPSAILEDADAQAMNFGGISAGPNESQSLTVTAVSNNPGLIPDPTVNYTGPDTTGSLSYKPVANQWGTATITVTVTDDGGTVLGGINTFSQTFTITVTPVNDAPTLDIIPDQPPIDDADPHTIDLTGIFAGPIESQSLTVTAVSDNPGLVPNPTVDYTSANSAGTLTFALAPNQAGIVTITVTVTDNGGNANGGENTISRSFIVGAVNDAPTLDTIPDRNSVLEDANTQTVDLAGITAGGGESQTLTVTATSSNLVLIPNPTVTYISPNSAGSLNFRPLANQWGSTFITVKVKDNGGTALGGVDEITRTFTVNVLPQPDAPSIDTAIIPMVAAVPLRPKPTNPPGSPVSSFLDGVTEIDGDPLGLAVTGIDNLKGVWQYSLNNGDSWEVVPTNVSLSAALLLSDAPTTRLRFLPSKRFQGFASFRFKAWDQSDGGSQGTQIDSTLTPTAYSDKIERGWVAVGKTKPVVNANGATLMTAVKEDKKSSRTFAVKNLLGIAALESAPAINLGIAITSATTANGTWQYRPFKTKAFLDVGSVSLATPLLLHPKDTVRFIPKANSNGQAALTFKTWDQVAQDPTGPGFGVDYGYAVIDITPINDRPVLDLSVPAVLNPVDPSQTTNERSFASMMSATDVEGATIGVAIVGAKGSGWQYKHGNGSFFPLGTVSMGKALLLNAGDRIRYASPVGEKPATATLSFKAWDMFPKSGVAGARVPIRGTAFSKQTETVTVAIDNDAPVLDTTPDVNLPKVISSSPKPIPGTLVKNLLGAAVTDSPNSLQGIAIVFADDTNGKWQYSLDGRTYLDIGPVSAGSALLLADVNKLRFVPISHAIGPRTIQFKAWDRTTGQAGDRIDTGLPLNSFSLEVETATVSVG